MTQAVSSPINLRNGVRGTSGRGLPAQLVARPQPQLDEEARRLLAVAAAGKCNVLTFAEAMLADPSPAGVQALAHLAWSARADAQSKFPGGADDPLFDDAKSLEKAAMDCADLVAGAQAGARTRAKLAEAVVYLYGAGVLDGRAEAKKEIDQAAEQPIRRTEFVSDAAGKITGKLEYELKPGGKS